MATDAEKYDKAFREGKIPPHARGGSAFKSKAKSEALKKKMGGKPYSEKANKAFERTEEIREKAGSK